MIADAFTPSPEIAAALARSGDDGRPLYELRVPKRDIVEDLSDVPSDATFIATRGTAKKIARVGELARLEALWASPASPALFEACARAPSLRAIHVYQFNRLAEVRLAGARTLEHLMLSWAANLVDLSFLGGLPALRTIYLDDMKRVDLATLPVLPNVIGLHLGGGIWDALKVESLEPITRLPSLRYLRLSNVRPGDESLQPLTQLPALRELQLPNLFELEEVARLAGALPNVASNTLTPVFHPFDGVLPAAEPYLCESCGGPRQMMTGRPGGFMCPACDDAKIRKRVARWEAARNAGW